MRKNYSINNAVLFISTVPVSLMHHEAAVGEQRAMGCLLSGKVDLLVLEFSFCGRGTCDLSEYNISMAKAKKK